MPDDAAVAVVAWEMMGGMDWRALDVVAELLGVEDIERFVVQLLTIREFKSRG